jgi:hypothetical protein
MHYVCQVLNFLYVVYIISKKEGILDVSKDSENYFFYIFAQKNFFSFLCLHPERDPRGQQAFWWTLPLGYMAFHLESKLIGESHEIFCFRFFYESSPPKPPQITLGSFRIFRKFKLSSFKFFSFATGVNDIGGAPWSANISANFKIIRNGSNGIFRGLGETDL